MVAVEYSQALEFQACYFQVLVAISQVMSTQKEEDLQVLQGFLD